MAGSIVKMWIDSEADILEITFERKPDYSLPTEND
jgi:hypothetical protein